LALSLGLTLILLLGLQITHAAPTATIRYVLGSGGTDTSDCTDPDAPCETIQYALAQANSGDTIRVANKFSPAIYSGGVVITKSITLEGGWRAIPGAGPGFIWERAMPCEPSRTTIDAGGAGRAISITGNITPTVDCFTITGGDATGLGGGLYGNDAGGGICSRDAAPLIVNNVITANYGCTGTCPGGGGNGGGIYLLNAPATAVISNNLVAYNVGDGPGGPISGQGGGIMLRDSDTQILSNTIEHNLAGDAGGLGGGIAIVGGSPTIADNIILQNQAGQAIVCLGGGIYVLSSMPVTIERNFFQYNMATNGSSPGSVSRGGGLYYTGNPGASAVIRDNLIRWNYASTSGPQISEGGGMYLTGLSTPSLVSGNIVQGNYANWPDDGSGGGIYVGDSEVTISNNRIMTNSATWNGGHGEGGGLYIAGGSVLVQSNVISDNRGAGFGGFPSTATGYGGGMAISGSLTVVQDNWIVNNDATNGLNLGAGGGIYGFRGALYIAGNTIAGNRATGDNPGFGGGLYLEETLPTLEGNTIVDNVAAGGSDGRGGGVRINRCAAFTLTNNIVARNQASRLGSGVAIAWDAAGNLAHNTIAENSSGDGVGVYVDLNSEVKLSNNIIVSHSVGITVADPGVSTVSADHTLFEGNGLNYGAGVTSINAVAGPAALMPANYHLTSGSGAIDHAVALAWVTRDIDGDPRPLGVAPDVGADEARFVYLPLVLR
jgi:hypothetical protein